MIEEPGRIITLKEFELILYIMSFYHRTEGYIGLVDDKVYYFDSNPSTGGAFITKQEVIKAIESYGNRKV